MSLVGMVLLIACVNLSNMMLARAGARREEIGIRVALGAGAWQLIRQLLIESITLSITGAGLGILFGFWTSRFLLNLTLVGYVPYAIDPAPDVRVLAFTTGVAVLTGVFFGLVPALGLKRVEPAVVLRQNSRAMHGRAGVLSKVLVSAQVAISLLLVMGAVLLVRSLIKMQSVNPGFRRDGVLLMQLFSQAGRERIPNRMVYYRELAERLSQLPG